ncbi:MAG: hypothetical protein IPK77_16765 [Cellvibrio sp.]|nr:hypothetical protein [Cellvibrio sp.]
MSKLKFSPFLKKNQKRKGKSKSVKFCGYNKAMLRMPFLLRFCIRGAHCATKAQQKSHRKSQRYTNTEESIVLELIPRTVYEGISFKSGEFPNFELLKSCFIEQGIFINNKGEVPLIKSVPEYISMIGNNISNGNIISIHEKELASEVEVFGRVAQIKSEYSLVFEGKGGVQVRYGVNLFQAIDFSGKWLISSMCWDDRADTSLIKLNV